MSRLWNRSVRLRLASGSAAGTLAHGWLRRKVLAEASHTIDGAASENDPATGSPPPVDYAPQIQAIDRVLLELAQAAPLQGARLLVELADALLHLDVVTGDFAAEGDRQLQTVAVACVGELLGDAADRYEVRWQLQRGGRHLMIAAIARRQLDVLREAAARHGLRLRSVMPDFCLQWNRHAPSMKPGPAVFAVANEGEAVIAQVSHGTVTALSRGAWLDSRDPAICRPSVQRLMSGLGLDATVTAGVLDVRVDRLLACQGLSRDDQSGYLLVAPNVSERAVSSRWTVVHREVAA